jgi:hypothetical protein
MIKEDAFNAPRSLVQPPLFSQVSASSSSCRRARSGFAASSSRIRRGSLPRDSAEASRSSKSEPLRVRRCFEWRAFPEHWVEPLQLGRRRPRVVHPRGSAGRLSVPARSSITCAYVASVIVGEWPACCAISTTLNPSAISSEQNVCRRRSYGREASSLAPAAVGVSTRLLHWRLSECGRGYGRPTTRSLPSAPVLPQSAPCLRSAGSAGRMRGRRSCRCAGGVKTVRPGRSPGTRGPGRGSPTRPW